MFHFKQFSIEDSGATMKVGTDAVLLGALACTGCEAAPALPCRILDIGTGCGILALMMAQRFANAIVDAIDIDSQTIDIAAGNFLRSPWSRRLNAENISLQQFTQRHSDNRRDPYDLIVSNPPYFTNSLKNNEPRRRTARHDDTLSLAQLLQCASTLMTHGGRIAIIIPSGDTQRAIDEAHSNRMSLTDRTDIVNHLGDKPKRSVLQFTQTADNADINSRHATVALRDADNNYSAAYQQLTQPFLL